MRRRMLVATVVAGAFILGSVSPQLASSSPSQQDPRAQRDQVRAQQAQTASQINVSKATLSQIDKALQVLDGNLQTQQAALSRADAEVAQAKQDIADAESAIHQLTNQIGALRTEMRRRAVRAYVDPPADNALTVLQTNDFTTASNRKFYIELRAQSDADVADRLNGATADLAYQKKKASEAKQRAEVKQAEQARRTTAVRLARHQQQRVYDAIQSSMNSQIARSIQLAKTDRKLSAEIAQQEAALQARLLAAQAAANAAAYANAHRPSPISTQGPNGGETGPLPPVGGGTGAGIGTGGISLCTVGGITVNCLIQGQLGAMLNAARAAGINLTGSGYRDPAEQILLRQQHCGSSYYAIYQMSPSACSPPTARPGTSQHEVGLAIDFSNCGYGTPVHNWLDANAARFGFYNLPSESWHWSTTGS